MPGSHVSWLAAFAAALLMGALFYFLPNLINSKSSIRSVQFKTYWSRDVEKRILTRAVAVKDVLVYDTADGYLEAVSARNGRSLWSLKISDYVFALEKDGSDIIYAGSGLHTSKDAWLVAVDAVKGTILWKRSYQGHIEEPPLIDEKNHRMWFGAGPGSLWAVDTRDGATLWTKNIGHLDATPLLHGDVLYVPAQKSTKPYVTGFYALRAKDGEILWSVEQPGQPWASPLIDKTGKIIMTNTGEGQIGLPRASDKGWVQAVSTNGAPLWEKILPDMALTPNVYFPDRHLVLCVTKNGTIVGLNIQTGDTVWQQKVAGQFSAEGIKIGGFDEDLIAATSSDGVFYILDAATGAVLFHRKMGKLNDSVPSIDGKIIYIPTSHNITALIYE